MYDDRTARLEKVLQDIVSTADAIIETDPQNTGVWSLATYRSALNNVRQQALDGLRGSL